MTKQQDLARLLQQALRLSTLSDKAEDQLQAAVQKWFEALFVRSMKLGMAKEIYRAGAFEAFRYMLMCGDDGMRVRVLMKLDKHNLDALKLSKDAAFAHIENLASEKVKPAPQAKKAEGDPPAKRKKTSEGKTLIQSSKY